MSYIQFYGSLNVVLVKRILQMTDQQYFNSILKTQINGNQDLKNFFPIRVLYLKPMQSKENFNLFFSTELDCSSNLVLFSFILPSCISRQTVLRYYHRNKHPNANQMYYFLFRLHVHILVCIVISLYEVCESRELR